MKTLREMTDRSLKARARREILDINRRIERGDPGHVLTVCGYALRATLDELARRGIEYPPKEVQE